jgi:hypothetical protein
MSGFSSLITLIIWIPLTASPNFHIVFVFKDVLKPFPEQIVTMGDQNSHG